MGEILDRMLSNIPSEFDTSVGSFFYDVCKSASMELDTIYADLQQMLQQGFALTGTGEFLDLKVAEQGLGRKASTFASGVVTITGTSGSIISSGSKVASDNVAFTIVQDVTVPVGGSIDAYIVCDTSGIIGNVPAGSIKTFPVTISGVTAVINASATSGGYDIESDVDLRGRYFEKLNTPVTSGNKQDYINWAKEVSGIGDVKVLPLWNGNGTVKVIIVDSNKGAANAELIANVTANIEINRPVGATVTVASAVPLAISVSATLVLSSTATVLSVTPNIKLAIENYIKQVPFEQNYISYAKIGGAILSCSDVLDYTNLKVNNGTVNVAVSQTQVPVMGVVTLA